MTNFATFIQFVNKLMDRQEQVDTIYTDFSQSFDTLNHILLLHKLDFFGFSPSLCLLIQSYLIHRTKYVFYNGFRSSEFQSMSGVPQGSNLRPLLFNIFSNDLLTSLSCPVLDCADDVKLFCCVSGSDDANILQHRA